MIVEITSFAPTVAFSTPAIPAQNAPASEAATTHSTMCSTWFIPAKDDPTHTAAIDPTRYWPWPPMLNSPARKAKATVGANEVISTIMLNYIALWIGVFLFGLGGPLQNSKQASVPVSNDVVASAKLPVFWGDPELQGLHVGLFIALAALIVFWVLLNRSTTGYEVRAVGLNPEAARYGGMNVAKNYVLVMAVCGVFAGIAGSMDVLGWQFRIATNDILASQIGFLGIAVALLGRNTASGTAAAALLFGALVSGTSQRNLDPSVFAPELASNLTIIIQGLVVLFVSADVLVIGIIARGRRLARLGRKSPPGAEPAEEAA